MSSDKLTIKQLEQKLREYENALPEVYANTINRVAKVVHNESIRNIKKDFKIRNNYSLGSMRYYQAKPTKNVSRINAITGTVSTYLDQQDEGGTAKNLDGSPERSMPSARARKKQYDTRPVIGPMRPSNIGKVARVHKGKWQNRGARFFLLTPGEGNLGLNSRKTTKKWQKWNAKFKSGATVRKFNGKKNWEYKLTEPTIFMRQGGKLVRVLRILRQPIHLKATHWQTGASARFGTQATMMAAFKNEAEKMLTKLGAKDA